MKLSPLRIGFSVSIFCHTIALGLIMVMGGARQPPAIQQDDIPITLTLVAAPDEPAVPEVHQTVASAPPPPTIEPPKPVDLSKPIIHVEKARKVVVAAAPRPPEEIPQQPQAPFRGDATSVDPGRDATTMQGQPEVKAKPNYLKNPEPLYPAAARRRHEEGLVLLSVTVTAGGRVRNVSIKQSSHFPLLDQSAMHAVEDWMFEPARVGSHRVEFEIEVPVRFQLTD